MTTYNDLFTRWMDNDWRSNVRPGFISMGDDNADDDVRVHDFGADHARLWERPIVTVPFGRRQRKES